MPKKRPLQDNENRSSKRFQPELFDSEDEEEMCRIADEVEQWSGDEDWEELMSRAVDNYEQTFPKQTSPKQTFPKQTLPLDQFGQGQQSSHNAQPAHQLQQHQNQGQHINPQQPHSDNRQLSNDSNRPLVPQQATNNQRPQADDQRPTADNQTHRDHRSGANFDTALNDSATTMRFTPRNNLDIPGAFRDVERALVTAMRNLLQQHRNFRGYLTLEATYSRLHDGEILTHQQLFRSQTLIFSNEDDIEQNLAEMMREIFERSQEFQAQGSGWTLDSVDLITLHAVKYHPLRGSSYIRLPREIELTRSVLNIRNTDQKCAVWSILAFLHPVSENDHPQRVTKYRQYEEELNTNGVGFPTSLKDIKKLEDQNDFSINVFGYDPQDKVYPMYKSKKVNNNNNPINLLLISEAENRHYCLIRNFSRLLAYRTKYNGAMYFCYNCLHGFSRQELLDGHKELCYSQQQQTTILPQTEEEKEVKFKSLRNQLPVPFVIYADLESYTEKIDHCLPDPTTSSTTEYQRHTPSGFCYMVVSTADDYTKRPVLYRGPNVIETFFERLLQEYNSINRILSVVKPMQLSPEEQDQHQEATACFICGEPFGAERPVRDHDHVTGKYRGAAHTDCNLSYNYRRLNKNKAHPCYRVPVIFHNLRGYDGHMLMSAVGKYKNRRISCIANNSEKYVTFSLSGLQFIDSFQFMGSSLEKLVGNLNKEEFKMLRAFIDDDRKQRLLLRKGVYPYDYVDSPTKLNDTELPRKEEFYSKLNDEGISDEDYKHAVEVWNEFDCETLGDYHDVYLASDVLLLADVFENFRKMAMETYKLDPAHYCTAPGLSWDAMLKLTKVRLQLIDDPDMYLMIESGLRGGVSMITKKHAIANNPLVEGYDDSKPTNYLMYLDANNLYGWAMSQKLPEKEFDWMTDEQLEEFDVTKVPDDSETGYILEVDLSYPPEIHDEHNDLPVAPESRAILEEELSPYTQDLREKIQLKGKPHKKLIPNLDDKTKYVLHYRNLKHYLQLGLQLKKIHRGVEFHQSFWLKQYISMNTERRKQARNSFEKDFYKLMNNSIFGKTMENVRGRKNIELVHTEKRMKKVAAKANFTSFTIFNKDLVAAHCLKSTILLNKPIFVGFAILDLSKLLMYDFHYGYIKKKYGSDAELCFTDTDSLLYDIKCKDIYKDMQEDNDMFDFSDYPHDHPLFNATNKKVLGKMKDETAGVPITEFVGLRSKMYSLRVGAKEKKTAKGIKKSVIRKHLNHAAYRDVLLKEKMTRATMNLIRSKRHQIFSITSQKIALSSYDDKRYVLGNKFTTRAHGHYLNHTETVEHLFHE